MMTVFIMPNLSRKNAVPCAVDAINRLHEAGAEILLDIKTKEKFSSFAFVHFMDFQAVMDACDVVIAIGGDGTILHTAKYAMRYNKPVLGINAGRLGFLAGLEMDETDRLTALAAGDYAVDRRMLLKVTRISDTSRDTLYALNDAVISKGSLVKIVDLDIYCGEQKIISHRADGIIFATPTGSTAYSLSAGGPVVDPSIDCISMTPVCSHSLLGRSIIFSGEKVLTVHTHIDEEHETYLCVDGERGIRLTRGDKIQVEKSDSFIRFVKLTDKPFYEILNEKILEKMGD